MLFDDDEEEEIGEEDGEDDLKTPPRRYKGQISSEHKVDEDRNPRRDFFVTPDHAIQPLVDYLLENGKLNTT